MVLGTGGHYVRGHVRGCVKNLADGVDVVVLFWREPNAVEVGSGEWLVRG